MTNDQFMSSLLSLLSNPANVRDNRTVVIFRIPSSGIAEQNSNRQPPTHIGSASDRVQAPAVEASHQRCRAARKEFLSYVKNLDRTIFLKTCKTFPPGVLKQYNDVVFGVNTDLASITAISDTFKEAANKTIMEEIVRLKSLMA